MGTRDDFPPSVRRTLAERAGQRCSNPQCGRSTSGPSEAAPAGSTVLGKAAHISAAAAGGPRYRPSLTSEQRRSAENGIWLCAECADRVDKPENAARYPIELLQWWKTQQESTCGTDLASVENRRRWPVRRLVIADFAGVQGNAAIDFSALTIVQGTSKLSHSVGKILRIFCRRENFERVRQPTSGNEAEMARWPIGERSIVVTLYMKEARHFADQAKLQLAFSDGRTFEISITDHGAGLYQGGVLLPSFSEVCKAIAIDEKAEGTLQRDRFSDDQRSLEERLSSYFGVSNREMISCLKGTVLDDSVFGYGFRVTRDGRCEVKLGGGAEYRALGALSSGEKARAMVEIGARLATYSARVGPTLFLVDRLDTLMDGAGVRRFLEWVEQQHRPFQTVVDLWRRPTCELHRALYYIARGTDMNVSGFEITPLRDLRERAR